MTKRLSAALWKQLLQRSARPSLSIQAQIREMLVTAILEGQLPAGMPVPSSRDLASHLGVARNTVVLAYRQLSDDGYLISRERSGNFVNPDLVRHRQRPGGRAAQAPVPASSRPDWHSRFRLHASMQRNIVKPSDWQRFPYPFLYGQFDSSLFPTADWRECCLKALSVLDIRDWAPDLIARDDEALVQQIASRVLPRRGVWATADEIIVTVGAQQALYLLADLLLKPGTRLAVEEPGYPDARNIFANRTERLLPVPVDDEGLVVDDRLRDVDYVYATPSHQCPTSVTMPLGRREALLRSADEHDFVVIEDDFESENRFDGEPIPALKSLDRHERVIYVGSLSKMLAPGLRIGFVVGSPELIVELRALRRLMIRHPSAFIQRAFALFLSLGHYDAQMRRISVAQRERGALVLQAMARYAPQCRLVPVMGGGSYWVELPRGVAADDLAAAARAEGVLVEPGDVFFLAEPPPGGFVRLGYQSITPRQIEPGIKALAGVIARLESRA